MAPESNLAAMQAAFRAAYARVDAPRVVQFDVTYRCDLTCQHCYLDDKQWPEMTTAEVRNLFDQLRDVGLFDLRFSGGEVFARPDFLDLLEYATRLGFTIQIKTHAGNMTPERAAAFERCGVRYVAVSVYSLHSEIHDAFTRTPGSLARTLAGIETLCAAGVPVRIPVVVQPDTIDEMQGIFDHFAARGCEVVFSTYMFTQHSGGAQPKPLELPGDLRVRAQATIQRLTGRIDHVPVPLTADGNPCEAGRSLAYISPDGSVFPCVLFPLSLGNLREQSFAEIWAGSPARQELVSWTNADRIACQSCGGSAYCFYCPGEAFKRTGDFRAADPGFRDITLVRMAAHEAATGQPLPREVWDSVPASEAPPVARKTAFPIHRPQRGHGRRVSK